MIICKICGYEGKQLHQHLQSCHDMNGKEYKTIYGKNLKLQVVSKESKQKRAKTIKTTGGSRWSEKYWMNKGMTREEAQLKVSDIQRQNSSKRKYAPEHCIINKKYWMSKHGYTEDQAIQKIREMQSDRSARSSRFSGKRHTKETRTQISISMSNHIQNVGVDKWITHFGDLSNGASKSEIECYNYIKENINPNLQAHIEILNYIADMGTGFNIIEFNGDYWHANPSIYESNQKIQYPGGIEKTAKEKWAEDAARYAHFISLGFRILVIWEHDWHHNRDVVIHQIKEFLL